jgi:hypothetical protein
MKLFRKRGRQPDPLKTAEEPASATAVSPQSPAPEPCAIALNAEQKDLLQTPVDPRVERILQEIYADRTAAEAALKARRIIAFPAGDSGERHVIQDEHGFWRIVPGAVPTELSEFFDAL